MMTKIFRYIIPAAIMFFSSIEISAAYMGPGLGAGILSTILGIFSCLGLLLAAIIWYPLRRLVRRLRRVPDRIER